MYLNKDYFFWQPTFTLPASSTRDMKLFEFIIAGVEIEL